MAIHDLKGQIGRLPEQPGRVRVPRARAARRCTSAKRACCAIACGRISARRARVRGSTRCCATPPRVDVIVTDSVVEALALENRLIKQRNPALQRAAARRQDLSVPAADDDRAGAAPAGGAAGGARRQRVRRSVHARVGGAADDDPGASAVRHPVLQRSHRRPARPARASSTTSSAAWRPAWRAICSLETYGRAVEQARLLIEGRQDELVDRLRDGDDGGVRPARSTSARRICAMRRGRSRRSARGATRWKRRRWAIATPSASRPGRRARSSRCSRCGAAAWPIASNW